MQPSCTQRSQHAFGQVERNLHIAFDIDLHFKFCAAEKQCEMALKEGSVFILENYSINVSSKTENYTEKIVLHKL